MKAANDAQLKSWNKSHLWKTDCSVEGAEYIMRVVKKVSPIATSQRDDKNAVENHPRRLFKCRSTRIRPSANCNSEHRHPSHIGPPKYRLSTAINNTEHAEDCASNFTPFCGTRHCGSSSRSTSSLGSACRKDDIQEVIPIANGRVIIK